MKKISFVKYCHAIMGNDTSFIVNLNHEVSPFTQPFMRGKYCYRCQIMMQNVKMLYVIHIWCADLERSTSITFWCSGGIWSMHYYLTAWAEEDLLKSCQQRERPCVSDNGVKVSVGEGRMCHKQREKEVKRKEKNQNRKSTSWCLELPIMSFTTQIENGVVFVSPKWYYPWCWNSFIFFLMLLISLLIFQFHVFPDYVKEIANMLNL